ncbi:MAG TPA: leucyl aminopeptidase, partial [Roseateles sp.]|nr:leucyl aminopeptidase [Roseateles sp.]
PGVASLVRHALKLGDFSLKSGSVLTLFRPAGLKADRLVLAASTPTVAGARRAVNMAIGQLKTRGAVTASVRFVGFGADMAEALAEQLVLAAMDVLYVHGDTKREAPLLPKLNKLSLLVDKGAARSANDGLRRGQAIGEGVLLARHCADLPPNVATPAFLGQQARVLGRSLGLKVEVLNQKAIEALGMGSFLAVAKGSAAPPCFVVARYDGAPKSQAPVVLIGKGITFDSGGISLKPGAGMDEMKYDMCGAAAVLGTLHAAAQLGVKVNLVCLIPACENMPDGAAARPGDVVTSMSGQTIEILNTDAEGRLILCDALTYAERFKPAVVVDVATLTGAVLVALGPVRSGMYASDDELATALFKAGEKALDPCWRLPLDEEYAEGMKSNFADVANVAGREGGSVTAAKFLQRFARQYRWGHLDIAGTAWKNGVAKGATGRPVGLLTHFVISQVK